MKAVNLLHWQLVIALLSRYSYMGDQKVPHITYFVPRFVPFIGGQKKLHK